MYMSLLAAFGVLLARYSGQEDIVVGSPIANRQEAQLEEMIGFFVNRLVMRVRVRPEMSFRELLKEVQQTALKAYQYQDVPFERLVEEISPQRSVNTTPLYQVVFALQNAPWEAQRIEGIEIEAVDAEELQVRFDLEVHVWEREGRVLFSWLYNRDLFDRWRIEQMVRHYMRVLEEVGRDADAAIGHLDLLTPEERGQILEQWNDTAHPIATATLSDLFEAQVERTPDAVAVVYEGHRLTYSEVNSRANQLAHRLSNIVGPEMPVGIYTKRSLSMVISVIAILKARGVYLPLDADLPSGRFALILDNAQPRVVLTEADLLQSVTPHHTEFVAVDTDLELASHPTTNPVRTGEILPDIAAYILYTSGSMGRPKGVVVGHRQILNYLKGVNERAEFPSFASFAMLQALAFDFTVTMFFSSLCTGGCLHVIPEHTATDAGRLGTYLAREPIDCLKITPSHLAALQNAPQPERFIPRQRLILGGEASRWDWVDEVQAMKPGCAIYNHYGPTETTVGVLMYCLEPRRAEHESERVPLGRPLSNTRVYVLGCGLEPVPVGIAGELYIAGDGLARGYLKQPALTAERFVADPYGPPGTRIYRTGDLVKWRADGNLEFIGRIDNQVKIRGFRVELGEIETALRSDKRVRDAVVAVQGQDEEKRLVAYVVREKSEGDQAGARDSHIGEWQQLYESTYVQSGEQTGDFNIVGWESSYTGEPIAAEEMRIWVEQTVERLRRLKPRRVLEIGCGAGLLLTRLAGGCESYVGLDFSREAIKQLQTYLSTRRDLEHVELREGLAHELSFVEDNSVDLVILNSVVQYFPDIDYLLEVLAEAMRVTRPEGHIFVGDVRSLPLLEAYHASVQLYKAAGKISVGEVRERIRRGQQKEEELVIDAHLFEELGQRWEKLGRVRCWPKTGAYNNELSRFRYDVVMEVGGKKEVAVSPERWLSWGENSLWKEELEKVLRQQPQLAVGVRGIRDGRVAASVEAVRLLRAGPDPAGEAGQLRAACEGIFGEDPDRVMHLARQLGVDICWQGFGAEGTYDAIFNPRWREEERKAEQPRSYYRRYGNVPMWGARDGEFGRALQEHLRATLPEYMVPTAVMVLEALPLTANGKVDRKALPTLEFFSEVRYRAPRTKQEESLCKLFAEVLGLDRVGLDDNFFELGGDSIRSIQLVGRARKEGLYMTIRDVFQQPTVEALSAVIQVAQQERASGHDVATGVLSTTPIMRWLQGRGGPIANFCQSMLLEVPVDLRQDRLVAAVQELLDYHDALRLRLKVRTGK